MEAESVHGPQWIWKPAAAKPADDSDGAASENEDNVPRKRGAGEGDFVRPAGHIGVVLHNNNDGEEQDVLLRKYELSKLRYYFAIAVCSSVTVADAIYNQLDGVEMESSSMVFDLRFVPDSIRYIVIIIN